MKYSAWCSVAATVFLGFSSCPQAATLSATICPSKVVYGSNQEGTLKIYYQVNKMITAKVLPEAEAGFEALNPSLGFRVTDEAIAAMKSTLDVAAGMGRAVIVYYDSGILVNVGAGEKGYQLWSITGPLPKASLNCVQL
jgi:hypothetical protein